MKALEVKAVLVVHAVIPVETMMELLPMAQQAAMVQEDIINKNYQI